MPQLTPEGQRIVEGLARRYGFSNDAVTVMLQAVAAGGGTMAQFDHPEFGGMGQWSRGGMTMIGDMFNNALKARVDGLCAELAGVVGQHSNPQRPAASQRQSQSQGGAPMAMMGDVSLFVPMAGRASATWWPADLGQPSSVGQQNDIRYAVFPATRRLALLINGVLSVYDTLDHHIGGVSQQQSGDASLSFTSQHGLVRLSELPAVSGDEPRKAAPVAAAPAEAPAAAAPVTPADPAPAAPATQATTPEPAAPPPFSQQRGAPAPAPEAPARPSRAGADDDVFAKLERLAGLRDKGILSEDEFAAKKAELLARL
ncbi:MAG: SHOCT domain-containing protein [Rhodospirillales bacterium]